MAGLRKICKMYGRMKIQGEMYVWDYARDEPVKESEMTKEQFGASEKAKWMEIKKHMDGVNDE